MIDHFYAVDSQGIFESLPEFPNEAEDVSPNTGFSLK